MRGATLEELEERAGSKAAGEGCGVSGEVWEPGASSAAEQGAETQPGCCAPRRQAHAPISTVVTPPIALTAAESAI